MRVKRTLATSGSTLENYEGAPHGMCTTFKDQVNEELPAFFKE
jgi:non-heme chloroperoxidase